MHLGELVFGIAMSEAIYWTVQQASGCFSNAKGIPPVVSHESQMTCLS